MNSSPVCQNASQETLTLKLQVVEDDGIFGDAFIDFFRLRLDSSAVNSTYAREGRDFVLNSQFSNS